MTRLFSIVCNRIRYLFLNQPSICESNTIFYHFQDLDREIEEMEKKIIACEFARQKLEDSVAQNQAVLDELEHLRTEQKVRNRAEMCAPLCETSNVVQQQARRFVFLFCFSLENGTIDFHFL